MNKKMPIIILTGPTAVGKSELSISLAKSVNGEIISADSMQVYKKMDIGTAKITCEEMNGVPHHMIDILEPWEEFNVSIFKENADRCIKDILDRGKIPILVGGTGFYIQAVLNDIEFTEHEMDESLRNELLQFAKDNGEEALHNRLRAIDPESAESIHPNNVKRVVRALEYCIQTGETFSEHNRREAAKESPYNFAYFVLNTDRSILYDRIDKRIDIMIENGLLSEVNELVSLGCHADMVSMKGLGYKEIIAYINGECTLEEAIYILKRETRHFAKRQLTWFKREKEVIWIDKTGRNDNEILDEMINHLKNKEII